MIVEVNGKEMEIAPEQTVLGLLNAMGVSPDTVVVECNGGIVPSAAFAETGLRDGDHLEVLRFVGGG
jgi:sulfur carrier protein